MYKRMFPQCGILVLTFALVLGNVVARAANSNSEADEIRRIERNRVRALVDAKMDVLRPLHADDYQLINPFGGSLTKDEYLGAIGSGELDYLLWEPEDEIAVRVHDQTATVRYRTRLQARTKEKQFPLMRLWHTDLYEKREGRWQVVWSQATEIKSAPLTEAEARAIVTPWYSLFTVAGRGNVRAVFNRVIAPDFQGYGGDLTSERRDRETTIRFIEDFGQLVPDATFEIKELFVLGDRVIVRGEATGTPAKEFIGMPPTGRRYQIMTIDILTIANGMITKTYHLENWWGALEQLRAGAK